MGDVHQVDVVVVGCGIAGLSAAVTAHQAGARVAVLERAPREDRGGNSRWTEAYLRMKSEADVADDFEAHFGANAGHNLDPSLLKDVAGAWEDRPGIVKALGFTDPELIGAFAAGAGPALAWLKGFGVKFDFLPNFFITTCTTRMAPVGGGLAMVEALAGWAEQNGLPIHYQTAAQALIIGEDGAVIGLRARDGEGRAVRFAARAVVLACGGFEGNPEMTARYYGGQARYIRPVARGGYYNRGDGHRMALALGAAPAGDWSLFHAEPIDPRSGQPEPVVMVFNYGILVNRDGRRFADEAPATVDATYEAITRRILAEPEGRAWVILDGRIDDVPNWRKAIRSDQPALEAASLGELAAKTGLDADALAATVVAYNAACPRGGRFDPLAADGLATSGIAPRKSNWARPLDRPPFRAWPIACANCFTFGGVKVDTSARVLDGDGLPIPGLYAGGELIGLYHGTYTGATSVLRGAVFGRAAGAHAARRARENTP